MKEILLFGVIVSAFNISGCSDEKIESKSMEQLQTENGTPVEVEVVQPQHFEKSINFFGMLSGVKQSVNGAMIGGRVEKINVKVGDYVKKGDIIMEWPTDAPGGMFEQVKAAHEMSEKNFERMKKLLEAGETSQANFDGVKTQYEVNKRNFELQKQLHKLEAPFDGMITNIAVKAGDNVKAEAPVYTIAQLHKMRSKVWTNDKEISQIKKGMKVLTEFRGKSYKGRVIDVAITPDPAKQAFYVEVEIDNSKNQLITGITQDIIIVINETDNAIIVPRNLVKTDSGGNYVFVAVNNIAKKKYITNGVSSGLHYKVEEGLAIGDKLIVKGTAKLVDGSKINVIE
ncbi:MAG: efflux RND transporter periplasmic adaptor subunit [Bacteroidetes bacterium]|nr:efflux RND transporter periplasmic adaptor subunit [Bacteroidota bacterium]